MVLCVDRVMSKRGSNARTDSASHDAELPISVVKRLVWAFRHMSGYPLSQRLVAHKSQAWQNGISL
jgi:hypothetical protein